MSLLCQVYGQGLESCVYAVLIFRTRGYYNLVYFGATCQCQGASIWCFQVIFHCGHELWIKMYFNAEESQNKLYFELLLSENS